MWDFWGGWNLIAGTLIVNGGVRAGHVVGGYVFVTYTGGKLVWDLFVEGGMVGSQKTQTGCRRGLTTTG